MDSRNSTDKANLVEETIDFLKVFVKNDIRSSSGRIHITEKGGQVLTYKGHRFYREYGNEVRSYWRCSKRASLGCKCSETKDPENLPIINVITKVPDNDNDSDDDVIEVVRDDAPIEILSDGEEFELEMMKLTETNDPTFSYSSLPLESNIIEPINYGSNIEIDHVIDPLTHTETITNNIQNCSNVLRFNNSIIPSLDSTTDIANEERPNHDDYDEENVFVNVTDDVNINEPTQSDIAMDFHDQNDQVEQSQAPAENSCNAVHNPNDVPADLSFKPSENISDSKQ